MSRTPRTEATTNRRSFLKTAAVTGAGWALAASRGRAETAPAARSVIHIHLPGGMAQQESFDSKPYAPSEYRGPFKSIATKVDGLTFSELFKDLIELRLMLFILNNPKDLSSKFIRHEKVLHLFLHQFILFRLLLVLLLPLPNNIQLSFKLINVQNSFF